MAFGGSEVADAETLSELRERQIRAVTPPAVERVGRYWTNVSFLKPADVKHYGSKAANYGVVYRSSPGTLPGIGLSFDLWQDFMTQTMASGKTLKVEIQERLAPFLTGTNMVGISAVLDDIRDMIKDDAVFSAEQQAAIRAGLAIFNPNEKIRFRSSSNCEDLPKFSAAGLYDSYSGCLLDDELPLLPNVCRCDPQDDKRRSVFEAIQKVYASLYNDQAFLERRAFGIEESGVATGVLVHRSFPDEIELANGVANVDFYGGFTVGVGNYVFTTQRGAVSVVNPAGPELPEVVTGTGIGPFNFPTLEIFSTIRPPWTPVLEFPAEYNAFLQKFSAIANGYMDGQVDGLVRLNFEFKKTPEGLFAKQVRPVYTGQELVPSVMLPAKYRLRTYQGLMPTSAQQATIWSTHAFKSMWEVEVIGGVFAKTNSESEIYSRARGFYLKDGNVTSNEFNFVDGTLISTNIAAGFIRNAWVVENVLRSASNEEIRLRVAFPGYVPASTSIVNSTKLLLQLRKPGIDSLGDLVRSDTGPIGFGWPRMNVSTNGVTITTRFVGQAHPDVPIVGMGPTFDLKEWEETVITGLSTQPIQLRGFFSQSYKPSRHNVGEEFLFEPRLEEGMSAQTLNELAAANINQIYFVVEPCGPGIRCGRIELIGFDGARRSL